MRDAFKSWDDHWHAGKVLWMAGDQPLKTLSKRLDEHVGDWSLSRETGASLCYVVGPKAMGIFSVWAAPGLRAIAPLPSGKTAPAERDRR